MILLAYAFGLVTTHLGWFLGGTFALFILWGQDETQNAAPSVGSGVLSGVRRVISGAGRGA